MEGWCEGGSEIKGKNITWWMDGVNGPIDNFIWTELIRNRFKLHFLSANLISKHVTLTSSRWLCLYETMTWSTVWGNFHVSLLSFFYVCPHFLSLTAAEWVRVTAGSHQIPSSQSGQSSKPSSKQDLSGWVSQYSHGKLTGVCRSTWCRCDTEGAQKENHHRFIKAFSWV